MVIYVNNRSIGEVKSELTINGPKDSFIEDIETNYSLINKRLKKNIKAIDMNIGRISNTKIKIIYISNITNIRLVKNIRTKLKQIDMDAIIDSSYLKNSLEQKNNLFPMLSS